MLMTVIFSRASIFVIGMMAIIFCRPVFADETPHRGREWHATLFLNTWIDTRLPELPKNVVTGNLQFRNAHFFGGAVSYVPIQRFDIPFFSYTLRGNSVELEGQVVKHFGNQDHLETTGAVVIRSGEFRPLDKLSFNAAWANGLSYAFSHPAYERGADGVRGVNSRQLQYYMGIEMELTNPAMPNLHLVTKLHHRSGIYGLISPSKTGSNYIGVGLRWDIK
jgi:hypothetical protein